MTELCVNNIVIRIQFKRVCVNNIVIRKQFKRVSVWITLLLERNTTSFRVKIHCY